MSIMLLAADASLAADVNRPREVYFKYLFQNISRPDTAKGVVVASPSKSNPDYYYHWVRDAALVMDVSRVSYERETNPQRKAFFLKAMKDYVAFSKRNQETPTLSLGRYGEPKFYVDGRAFNEPWGRPQNDGPALRAITLIRFATQLLHENIEGEFIERTLYDSKLPTQSVIKRDLEFVANHWKDKNFDLWEEVRGHHFYTHLAQYRALWLGAKLADQLDDQFAAQHYRAVAGQIAQVLNSYWDNGQGLIRPTQNRDGGIDYKNSNIDTAIILGVIHSLDEEDSVFSPSDERVLATFQATVSTFSKLYQVNLSQQGAPVLGRYPEDRYNGYNSSGEGNPWFISTFAAAEFLYRLKQEYAIDGKIDMTPRTVQFLKWIGAANVSASKVSMRSTDPRFQQILKLLKVRGDLFLERGLKHANQETGQLDEQINRNTGYMQGASHLTWSYSSYLTALFARDEAP
ncbi:MAG: glycoside hydrolase family 15 protein [Bdellovibrionales bacterium]|nr:glycoside hydrolase family 15 protein [Bdellovibrionales bacterium]